MTIELFRDDAYQQTCEAEVVAVTDQGVVLDRTIFYPTGGGQPGDCGELVVGGHPYAVWGTVKDAESGEIVHQIEGDQLPDVGMTVVGEIDWQRRHRFMRLHTCMHLLCSVLKYPVTGGSIGEDRARLDFDMTDTVDKEALERDLNALIAADHKLSASWITDEEMEENMDLVRTMSVKPPMGQGKVRLISIESVDLQPCGGTHVSHTGEIGAVRIGKVEKKGKQNRRVNVHLVD